MNHSSIYDQLDPLYRAIWGKALHHGLWESIDDSPSLARLNLRNRLQESCRKSLKTGATIADIGCGYGVLSAELADDYEVVACTDSEVQAPFIPDHPRITVECGDWMSLPIHNGSQDGAVALESFSHFRDWEELMRKTSATLAGDGVLVVADWFGGRKAGWFLRRIAGMAGIPVWRREERLIEAAGAYGLEVLASEDLSTRVARTWTIFFKGALLLPVQKPSLIPLMLKVAIRQPLLLVAFPLIRLAYARKQLEYKLLILTKTNRVSSGQEGHST